MTKKDAVEKIKVLQKQISKSLKKFIAKPYTKAEKLRIGKEMSKVYKNLGLDTRFEGANENGFVFSVKAPPIAKGATLTCFLK